MDWTRIITRGLLAFIGASATALISGVSSGEPPNYLTWLMVVANGAIATTTTTEALIAKSADPAKRPDGLATSVAEEKNNG